jgi:hypothetical protein
VTKRERELAAITAVNYVLSHIKGMDVGELVHFYMGNGPHLPPEFYRQRLADNVASDIAWREKLLKQQEPGQQPPEKPEPQK